MKIEKNVEMPVDCRGCECKSYMNNLKVRPLVRSGTYLLKGSCIVCNGKYNITLDEKEYRNLKIQIILDTD